MKYLITGGCGFMGSNIAAELINQNAQLTLLDDLSREGSEKNLEWLKSLGAFEFVHGDVRSQEAVNTLVKTLKPDVVVHLAGQVAMTTSVANPRKDFEINVVGSLNILEALRNHCPGAIVLYSSSNKVYGDLDDVNYTEEPLRYSCKDHPYGFDENTKLDFSTPYGCSKGAADQYMLDYHKTYHLKTVVFRHSSAFGTRQFCTFDQGWIGWFVQQALNNIENSTTEPFTISGNGKQVRDVLFSTDLVSCYLSAVKHIEHAAGQAFNIGGGYENSISILELLCYLEEKLNTSLNYTHLPWRSSDQKVFIADIRKAKDRLSWEPKIKAKEGILSMIKWVK